MKKKLYRSRSNKIIGGVCGGIGDYFEVDPVLIRVLFVFLAFFHGSGLLLYLLLLIIVPQEPVVFDETINKTTDEDQDNLQTDSNLVITKKRDAKTIFGFVLLILGFILLLDNLIPAFDLELTFPLILIMIGIYLIFESIKNSRG
ncbi:MAG: PspC domain-containing protein [Ignavibacteria bacterium]